jgi:hypothetical protein
MTNDDPLNPYDAIIDIPVQYGMSILCAGCGKEVSGKFGWTAMSGAEDGTRAIMGFHNRECFLEKECADMVKEIRELQRISQELLAIKTPNEKVVIADTKFIPLNRTGDQIIVAKMKNGMIKFKLPSHNLMNWEQAIQAATALLEFSFSAMKEEDARCEAEHLNAEALKKAVGDPSHVFEDNEETYTEPNLEQK